MSTVERRRSPVYRQLEAYEESWQKDHAATRECWTWEDSIAVGIATAALIERADDNWRERVFRGVEAASDDANLVHRTLFETWLRVTAGLLGAVSLLETESGPVAGTLELRAAEARVKERLTSWRPPTLATAVGLRDMTLSPEAVAELEARIKQAAATPPAMPARRLEVRDASFLKSNRPPS